MNFGRYNKNITYYRLACFYNTSMTPQVGDRFSKSGSGIIIFCIHALYGADSRLRVPGLVGGVLTPFSQSIRLWFSAIWLAVTPLCRQLARRWSMHNLDVQKHPNCDHDSRQSTIHIVSECQTTRFITGFRVYTLPIWMLWRSSNTFTSVESCNRLSTCLHSLFIREFTTST